MLGLSACASQATSPTVRANRPAVSSDHEKGLKPLMGSCPNVGLKPTTPQYDAGRIVDPPVCEPTAQGNRPAATAAADPADEPPGVRSHAAGFRVGAGFKNANSVVAVLPTTTPPARSITPTSAASTRAGTSRCNAEPYAVGSSVVSIMSFKPMGSPARAAGPECAVEFVAEPVALMASCSSTKLVNARIFGSCAAIAASV